MNYFFEVIEVTERTRADDWGSYVNHNLPTYQDCLEFWKYLKAQYPTSDLTSFIKWEVKNWRNEEAIYFDDWESIIDLMCWINWILYLKNDRPMTSRPPRLMNTPKAKNSFHQEWPAFQEAHFNNPFLSKL